MKLNPGTLTLIINIEIHLMSDLPNLRHQVSQHTNKRITGVNMSNSTNISNKSISGYEHCGAHVIIDSTINDQNGECIALDLNQKRHFCRDSDIIVHECQIVDHMKKLIEDANNTELSSFGLELKIVDVLSQEEVRSSTIDGHVVE
jgi:hypothetical protein